MENTPKLKSASSFTRRIRGQGLTEYAIILSIVAIAAIWAASFFGDTVKASFVAMGSELTGGTKYNMVTETNGSLKKAQASTINH